MKPLRILISAYACDPTQGSEPGVGWNWVVQAARFHEVWVITRANNQPAIAQALATQPVPPIHWCYTDLPRWARWWKRGGRGVHLYYYLWQLQAYRLTRRLHAQVRFDVVHHLTFGTCWMPSWLALLPVPFIWGPVGGGETAPRAFYGSFRLRGYLHEKLRSTARWLGQHDPLVRLATRRANLVLAKAHETATVLHHLGAGRVQLYPESGLSSADWQRLKALPLRHKPPFRLLSIGRLVHWKGFHLALRAFARVQARLPASEYWLIGTGPEQPYLARLARKLGVAAQVRFWRALPRQDVFTLLAACDVLVHPSLHDSGGWVCPEAMAAARPVICLDLGGPAVQVTDDTGVKIPAHDPQQVVNDLVAAMYALGSKVQTRVTMGLAARRKVEAEYLWSAKGAVLARLYKDALDAVP